MPMVSNTNLLWLLYWNVVFNRGEWDGSLRLPRRSMTIKLNCFTPSYPFTDFLFITAEFLSFNESRDLKYCDLPVWRARTFLYRHCQAFSSLKFNYVATRILNKRRVPDVILSVKGRDGRMDGSRTSHAPSHGSTSPDWANWSWSLGHRNYNVSTLKQLLFSI